MGELYQESSYYGVNKFVEKTNQYSEDELRNLIPGTYTKDEVGGWSDIANDWIDIILQDYEESSKRNGDLEGYVVENLKRIGKEQKQTEIRKNLEI